MNQRNEEQVEQIIALLEDVIAPEFERQYLQTALLNAQMALALSRAKRKYNEEKRRRAA